MNDLNMLVTMFTRANIEFEVERGDESTELSITVERGYSGFVTVFKFDVSGMLIDMGAYE